MTETDLEELRAQAFSLLMKGDTAGGITDLKQVVAMDPEDAEAWLHLGAAYSAVGHAADAASALKQAVDLDGDDIEARLAYGRALVKLGKLDDAAFQLLQAAKVEPGDARVLKDLGVVFYDKRLYEKAVHWLTKACEAAPDDARARYALGLAHEARKDVGAAIAAYQEAVRRDGSLIDARRTLADALASIGEHESAIAELTGILEVDRTNEQAARNREVLGRALAEMRARRLLGKTERELEQSALYVEAQFRRREGGVVDGRQVSRFVAPMTELYVTLDPEPAPGLGRAIESMMLVFTDPQKAARAADDTFKVTIIAQDGSRKAANYATGASITFVREALGCPMTHASELYSRLLGGEPSVEWGGATLSFTSAPRPDKPSDVKNGILATRRAG
jgi:tetratricopeptide (TPR) repeat protein